MPAPMGMMKIDQNAIRVISCVLKFNLKYDFIFAVFPAKETLSMSSLRELEKKSRPTSPMQASLIKSLFPTTTIREAWTATRSS